MGRGFRALAGSGRIQRVLWRNSGEEGRGLPPSGLSWGPDSRSAPLPSPSEGKGGVKGRGSVGRRAFGS